MNDLKDFYNSMLLSKLIKLDVERIKARNIAVLGTGGWCLFILTMVGLDIIQKNYTSQSVGSILFKLIVGFIVTGVILCYTGQFILKMLLLKFHLEFKKEILPDIIKLANPNLEYKENAEGFQFNFEKTDIFAGNDTIPYIEDYITGKIDMTQISFCDLMLTDTDSHKSPIKRENFKGIYFKADFNKNFNGKTIILSRFSDNRFSKTGLRPEERKFGELVTLEDEAFNKEFCVYSNSQQEARYILSPSLMDKILKFKNKNKFRIEMSFIDDCLYIAVPGKELLLEPTIFKSVVDYSLVEKIYSQIMFFIDVVEELNLNTRIWSKY